MASNDMDILKMQEEAIKRVNEMRKKADYYVNSSKFQNEEKQTEPKEENEEEQKKSENSEPNSGEQNGIFSNLFDNLSEDNILVIVLILVLSQEGADQLLIFALLYLLL